MPMFMQVCERRGGPRVRELKNPDGLSLATVSTACLLDLGLC